MRPKPTPGAETILARYWRQIARLAARGDMTDLLPAILRLPDKLSGHKDAREVDYRLAGRYLRGLEPDEPIQRTVAALLEAHCLYRAGDTIPAQERFAEAVEESHAADDAQIALCLGAMGACGEALARMRGGDLSVAMELARGAVRKLRNADCDWLRAYAQHTLGRVLAVEPGGRKRARTLLQQAASAYRSPSVKDLRGEAYALHILGRLEADAGECGRALVTLHRGLSLMRRSRADRGTATLLIDIGWLRSYQQSHAVARSYAREAFGILDRCNDHRGLAKACHLIAWTSLCEGALAEAQVQFTRAHDLAQLTACPSIRSASAYYLARCAFEMRDSRGCRKWLRKAQGECECDPLVNGTVRALMAAQAVRGRQWDEAGGMLGDLANDLKLLGVARLEADGLFLCGFELCRRGRQQQAAPLLRRALEVAEPAQASSAVQAFLLGEEGAGLEEWLAAVMDASEQGRAIGRAFAQRYVDQMQGTVFTLHNLKNLVGKIVDHFEFHNKWPQDFPLELDYIREHAQEAAELAVRMWEAAKQGRDIMAPELEPFDLAAFAADQVMIGNKYGATWDEIKDDTCGASSNPLRIAYVADIEEDVPLVMADDTAMAQIIGNLKNNAEKYVLGNVDKKKYEGGEVDKPTVTISVKTRKGEDGQPISVVFGFADNGPGIHPDDQEMLFGIDKNPEDYVGEQKSHGWGVGLGYCRVATEAMGGKIDLESELGKGAAFYLEFPVAQTGSSRDEAGC